MGIAYDGPRWSLPTRIAFRFIFAYLVLYLPTVFFNAFPAFEWETDPYTRLCDPVVLWVGRHVFGVEITFRPAGSGDTTWNYVQIFCFAVLAAAVAVLWSVIDRRRPQYRGLNNWLRLAVRFALAMTMITYGSVKVIQSQFPAPSLFQLSRTYGDSSPMGLLWTFMGFSAGYNFFTGAGEMLGGFLLASRRTTLLGALVSFGVVAHVAVLNLCYDVPVKLLSLHLVAMSLLLLGPDLGRLAQFFFLNRATAAADHSRLFSQRWANAVAGILGPLVIGGFTVWSLKNVQDMRANLGRRERSPFFGVWSVEEFVANGQERPPVVTDASRWRRVIFDFPQVIAVQLMNDSRVMYRFELNEGAQSFQLSMGRPPESRNFAFTYERPEPNVLKIDGSLAGQSIRAKLRRTEQEFFLTNRGFHWINEYPLNR
jgi:hypothetical protein